MEVISRSDDDSNALGQKARWERNQKFVSYIREQMMHEYGFDLTESLGGEQARSLGPAAELKKLVSHHNEQLVFKKTRVSRDMLVGPAAGTR